MKALSVAAKIWAITVFMNAFLFGVIQLFNGHWSAIWLSMLILFGGYVVTLPLLLLIVPMVALSCKMPYGNAARIAWLSFFLVVLVLLFYFLFLTVFIDTLGISVVVRQLTGTTIAGLIMAMLTTRKSLAKLYNTSVAAI